MEMKIGMSENKSVYNTFMEIIYFTCNTEMK